MLPMVVRAKLAMTVFVCGFDRKGGGHGGRDLGWGECVCVCECHGCVVGLTIWFLLLKIPKTRFSLLCCSDVRESTQAKRVRL